MPILKVPEPYAVNAAYSKVVDAARMIGEECIALNMFRVGVDDETSPRCVCFNDVYENIQQRECPSCFGTSFVGGVKEAWRVWAIINDNRDQEDMRRQGGIYLESHNTVQIEPWPALYEQDYLVRVSQWDVNRNAPLQLADRFVIENSQNVSIRSGGLYGGSNSSQIAQVLNVKKLPRNHLIYRYNIMTSVQFPRTDGLQR